MTEEQFIEIMTKINSLDNFNFDYSKVDDLVKCIKYQYHLMYIFIVAFFAVGIMILMYKVLKTFL